jgi:hypothetical protein
MAGSSPPKSGQSPYPLAARRQPTAYALGYEAFGYGADDRENPFGPNTAGHQLWRDGWNQHNWEMAQSGAEKVRLK